MEPASRASQRPPDVRLPIRSAAPTPVAVLGPKRAFLSDQFWRHFQRSYRPKLVAPRGSCPRPRQNSLRESQTITIGIVAVPCSLGSNPTRVSNADRHKTVSQKANTATARPNQETSEANLAPPCSGGR